jgi:hypothetical protein
MSPRSIATLAVFLAASVLLPAASATELYVAPGGRDTNPGTRARPFATVSRARDVVRRLDRRGGPITVYLRGGTYELPETLVFTSLDSGTADAPVTYAAAPGEEAVLSGGTRLRLSWTPYRGGILKAKVPAGFATDQLFVEGRRLPMARYPNENAAVRPFDGYAADAIAPERVARWADPRGGFIHALHSREWGGFQYLITGKDGANQLTYEGGWQNNRRLGMHKTYRMVENIFEELDAPGEWFLDKSGILHVYPPAGVDLSHARVEGVRLRHLVELRGTSEQPVRFVTLRGLTFRHAARTFMDTKEPLLRSDWTIYRGGAVVFSGAEDCVLEDAFIDQVGGNAVFVDGYNRRVAIRGTHIVDAGASGVAFVGRASAVRSPLFEYADRQGLADIDRTPGPRSPDYPADCTLSDSLIHHIGRFEKQAAPVQIAMARSITVSHCSLYDVPRAGINIGDGCWGGHVIEHCDVFDTVQETGDHGAFNSWGRDRYWGLRDVDLGRITAGEDRELPRLDATAPTILRDNRWRCDRGWDIDLDDGSSNYEIRRNLCLNGGIKLREGFYRVCENNVMVNGTFHPHVWYGGSEDVFRHNIVFSPYKPIRVAAPWGRECDGNLLHRPGALKAMAAAVLQALSGRDERSLEADALFVDAASGDYRVKEGSPALALGFESFPMDDFGVQKPSLRALARRPPLPGVTRSEMAGGGPPRDRTLVAWLGAQVRNIVGLGDVSAYGLPGEAGVLLAEVPATSDAAAAGLRAGDVLLRCNGIDVDAGSLARCAAPGPMRLIIVRDQKEMEVVPHR